jgi:flagellar basal body-associated protein FliL
MALARKTLIIAVAGVLVLVVGIVGGAYVGLMYFAKSEAPSADSMPDPGPMMELGQFTSNLADQESHIVRLKVTVELADARVFERLNGSGAGWSIMMKDEVMKTLKDQRYDSVRFTEGMEKLKQDLKTRLNAILPRENGVAAINKVLFDEYMTQ